MFFVLRIVSALILIAGYLASTPACWANGEGPVYQRQREGAGYQQVYSNRAGYGRGFQGYGYHPYRPVVAGHWYARPYPHHFDYYRWRYSTPSLRESCPCEGAVQGNAAVGIDY